MNTRRTGLFALVLLAPRLVFAASPAAPPAPVAPEVVDYHLEQRNAARDAELDDQAKDTRAELTRANDEATSETTKRAADDAAIPGQIREAQAQAGAHNQRLAGYIVGGAGAAILIGGLLALSAAHSNENQITNGGLATSSDISGAEANARTSQALSYVAFTVGGAAVLTALGLILFAHPHAEVAPRTGSFQVRDGALAW